MNNYAVVQLNAIAKERGIRGNYKLRKVELINALEVARLVEQKVTYLMSRFQMIPVQFYNQTPWRPSNITKKIKQNFKKNLY